MKRNVFLSITILMSFFCVFFIGLINYQIIEEWFGKGGPANIGSIEVSYVSMARFLIDYGPPIGGSSWSPFWYFGFPTHLFYTPLLPFAEVALHTLFSMELWESYRFVTGLAYILSPISLFFLGWQLSKRVSGGLIAGVLFTVAPTIFYFLDQGVASDMFSADFLDPRRFTILVRWGEGPHIVALAFIPLVGVFYARFIEKQTKINLLLSAVFLGLTALTNAIGLFAALLLIASMTFVKFAQTIEKKWNVLLWGIGVGALALGLISFWYNLPFITNFFAEGGGTLGTLSNLMPWGILGAVIAVVFLHWFFANVLKDFGIASSFLYFLIVFTVVATYYFSAPTSESYRRIELLPQALRYNVEVDLAVSLFLGVVFVSLLTFIGKLIPKTGKRESALLFAEIILCGAFVFFGYVYIQPFFKTAQKAAGTEVSLDKTREAEVARWLSEHVDEKKGERVFVPGNYGFYLNWFSDVWQHRGGLFQASTHFWPDHIHYQLATGKSAEIARAWLVASNAKYAVVPTHSSAELYKDIEQPDKFSIFPVALEEKGDIIYEIPLKRPSLAKPVSISAMQNLKTPVKADDKEPLLAYADWVEDSSANNTTFTVIDNDRYIIEGNIQEGEGILVQMTSDSGWSAKDAVSGKGIKTGKDPLGFLVLYPQAGEVDIALKHGRIWQEWLGYLMTIGTVIFVIFHALTNGKVRSLNHA